jgi:hypothetical protein
VRFQISKIKGDSFEMIGDVVEMPNSCGEVFVVHYNPFVDESWGPDDVDAELFRVSHVGTGKRVRGGATIDEAIERAAIQMRHAGEDGVRAVIQRARESATA